MEALARIAGVWAHSFNEILTIVLSKSHLMAEDLPTGYPELRADLDDLRRAARRGADMTEKLLAFATHQPLDLETLDLIRVVREMERTLLGILPASVELDLDVPESGTFRVRANPAAVQQILLNLVTNARDAMLDGGVLKVQIERTSTPGEEGGVVHLIVSDSGSGMDPSVADHVFEPFYTTKGSGRGIGLGLSIVHGLVRRQGGRVRIRSTAGEGTTVEVGFSGAGAAVRGELGSGAVHSGQGRRAVLVAEDEEAIRRSMKRVLERYGYAVLQASDGVEALGLLDEYGSEIDLVVSDIVMPRLDGLGLYREARERGAMNRFLFTSGFQNPRIHGVIESDPTLSFLAKPWSVPEFVSKVEEMLDLPPEPLVRVQ